MATRKTSPPEEEKPQKPETKTKPTAKKAPAAKKPTATKTAEKKPAEKKPAAKKTTAKKTTAKKTAGKKKAETAETQPVIDNSPGTDKKERPRSPVNGVPLPEGRKFTTGESAREAGRKGARVTNEKKRVRKTLREELLGLLQVVMKDSNGAEHTQQEAISVALIRKAREGDVRAFAEIRDTIGEKFAEKVELNVAAGFSDLDNAFGSLGGDAR